MGNTPSRKPTSPEILTQDKLDILIQYQAALDADPDNDDKNYNSDKIYYIAYLLMLKGEYLKSIEACKHAIKLDPSHLNAYKQLARSYDEAGMLKEAVAACEEAIRLDTTGKRTGITRMRLENIRHKLTYSYCHPLIVFWFCGYDCCRK
jgi:tetratricopeptide (TPR) repeat protein